MAYITREDGTHFVIPSYRDVLSAKQKSQLKKDILLLSQSYGEYITMRQKGVLQYEVAFSPDTGYLLGETVWNHFKSPEDMIYCESIPNSTEAILVIVKEGSVYLDGSFPLENIPEELVIFLTQKNHFEVFVYGDVPIARMPEPGKFSFDDTSIKSFTVLDAPAFPALPLLKPYQFQLVDPVLKTHGIGVFPVRQLLGGVALLALLWFGWSYLMARPEPPPPTAEQVNPFQAFNDALSTPTPAVEIQQVVKGLNLLFTLPGWSVNSMEYANKGLIVGVRSAGSPTKQLFEWAEKNHASVNLKQNGIYVALAVDAPSRGIPNKIFPLKEVLSTFVDRLAKVLPGNNVQLSDYTNTGVFTSVGLIITITNASPIVLGLVGDQMKDLPFVLDKISVTLTNGVMVGTINIRAFGN